MSGPWKLFTLTHNGQPILVNTALFETVRPDPDGTRLYPRVANQSVFLGVAEPFELVCAMLTEQSDEDLRDELFLCTALKREYQEQLAEARGPKGDPFAPVELPTRG